MIKAILVPQDGAPEEIEIDNLEDMQNAVGGYIESVPWIFDNEPSVYVNETGKFDDMPNRAVHDNDGRLVEILFGPILCIGFDPATGELVDISDAEIERVKERFGEQTIGSGFNAALELLIARRNDER